MGTDRNRPVGYPFSGTQALLGEMRLTQDSLRTMAEAPEVLPRSTRTRSPRRSADHRRQQPLLPARLRATRSSARRPLPPYRSEGQAAWPHRDRTTRLPVSERKDHGRAKAGSARTLDARTPRPGRGRHVPELRTALNNPVQQPGLTLAAQAAAFKGTAKEASVALVIELQGAELEFAPQPNGLLADTIEVSFFALNDDGRAQRGTRSALNLAIRPETYQRVKTLGLRLNARTTMRRAGIRCGSAPATRTPAKPARCSTT